jgi:alpha/beta superfamily hydrolase
LNFRGEFVQSLDDAGAVLLVPHPHSNVEGFDFHAVILATDETQMKHGFLCEERIE